VEESKMNWKTKTMVLYVLGGLVIGILAGIMTVNNAEKNEKEVDLSLKNAAKITAAAFETMKKLVIN